MRVPRTILTSLFLAGSLLLASCAGSDTSRGAGEATVAADANSEENWVGGEPVTGDVVVSWKNLDPKYDAATVHIVNASSEVGQKLLGGRATSSEVRVASDAQMGGLIAQMRKLGFFDHAVDGLDLGTVPDTPGRKGIVVVTQSGRSKGLMLTTNLGRTAIPEAYTNAKKAVLIAHNSLPGLAVKAGMGEADERVFSAPPPPRLKRP